MGVSSSRGKNNEAILEEVHCYTLKELRTASEQVVEGEDNGLDACSVPLTRQEFNSKR